MAQSDKKNPNRLTEADTSLTDISTDNSDRLFRNAFDYAAIGMALLDPRGTWLKVNPALCSILGYSESELLSTSFQKLVHPEDLVMLLNDQNKLLEGSGGTYKKEIRCFHKRGHILWILLDVSLVREEHGAPLHTIVQIQDVSTRKQLEQKLNSLIEYNPAGIISLDMEGKIDGMNSAMEEIIGYRKEDLLNKSIKTIIAGEHVDLRFFQDTIGGNKEQFNHDITIVNKQGDQLYLGAKDVPIIIDGQIVGFYVIARDITDLKKTKEKLDVLQQDLLDVVSKQQGMTFKFKRMNGSYIHTLCDGELVYRLGYRPELIVGRELREFIKIPHLVEAMEECYHRAWWGEENVTYEGQNGDITFLVLLKPIKRKGEVVEIIASCIDITERKRAEEDLRATKEMLESFINNTSDAIDVVGLDGNVIQVNRAFEKIYGYTESGVIGKPLNIIVPEEKIGEKEQLIQQLNSGSNITNYETTRIRKDRSLIYITLTLSLIKDVSGKTIAFAAISRDITESKKTEELLRKSDRLSVVGQLAAGLAHEIRNPLTSIKGFLQLMQAGVPSQQHYYEIMISELDRINFIVSEFLIISKPQVTQYAYKSINRILDTVIQLIEPEANMNNVKMYVNLCPESVMIRCSEIQMKQVFINLLKNAIEAMPNGGGLRIDLLLNTQEVTIRLTDTGTGIAQDRLTHLGEPFYTTKEKGTGLGLMMCFKIIEAHQGRIGIRSQLNEGTTVDVTIPVQAKEI